MSYTAIIIDSETHQTVWDLMCDFDWEKEATLFCCHHVTLALKPISHKAGEVREFKIVGYGRNELAAAFLVEGVEDSINEHPHITACCYGVGRPKDSNSITEWKYFEPIDGRGQVKILN